MKTPKREQPNKKSGIEVYFFISPSKVSGFFSMPISKRLIKSAMRGAGKFAMILLVFQLLDRPAVVVPESLFVVVLAPTPYRVLDLDRQFDEPLISGIDSRLKHIRYSKAPSLAAV